MVRSLAKSEGRIPKSDPALRCIYIFVMDAIPHAEGPLLVYDGECGFCARSVQFVLKHERRHDLRFVPRDSEFGKELRRRFHLESVESMLWIEGDQAFVESDSTLHAAQYVGGIWAMLARIALLIPAALRNLTYRFVARNRKRISARMNVCLVPTPEQKLRFLS